MDGSAFNKIGESFNTLFKWAIFGMIVAMGVGVATIAFGIFILIKWIIG